jgi:hypothetical protein
LLNESKAHNLVIQLGRDHPSQEQLENNKDILRDSHAIRWSHTSLAITSEKLFKEEYSNCNGYIEALGQFILSPGHRLLVEKEIQHMFKHKHSSMEVMLNDKMDYCRYQIGIGDMVVPYGPVDKQKSSLPLLKISSFLAIFTETLMKFRFGERGPCKDIVYITANLTVPVPKIVLESICKKTGAEHFHPLTKVLYQIRNRLCYLGVMKDELKLTETGPRQGLLDIQRLKNIPYVIPVSLQRMIEYLYQNFAVLIGDPYTFDLVLDLYDTLSTLHAILTKHITVIGEPELEEDKKQRLPYLDEGRVAQLSAIVDAIHNTLIHRIAKAHKETNYREMEIDFRGGLNQILLAADAPIKCGLGLIRKLVRGIDNERQEQDRIEERDRVGGLTLISSMPGVRINNLNFGVTVEAQLAYFEADVPHVLHPPSYCDNLHELFHLIFDILWNRGKFEEVRSELKRLMKKDFNE